MRKTNLSLLSAAAGAALAYYLYGTDAGERSRKRIKKVAYQVKEKSADALDDITDKSREFFEDTTDLVKEKYDELKILDKKELTALGKRMKHHWDEIKEDIEETLDRARND